MSWRSIILEMGYDMLWQGVPEKPCGQGRTPWPGRVADAAVTPTDIRRIAGVMVDKGVDGAAADPMVTNRHGGSAPAERLPGRVIRKVLHRARRDGVRVP